MGKTVAFAVGIGLGMIGQKYGKDLLSYCKDMKKLTCKTMQDMTE